jgi:hypothetical protein
MGRGEQKKHTGRGKIIRFVKFDNAGDSSGVMDGIVAREVFALVFLSPNVESSVIDVVEYLLQ